MSRCLIGLGANLGTREEMLQIACSRLARLSQASGIAASSVYATPPIGGPSGQSEFLNAAAAFDTTLSPQALLRELQAIERDLGRIRAEYWAARTIDLDLLLYGLERIDEADLTVPHPRMAFRRFVLVPAAEIAAEMIHPETGWTIRRLREHLDRIPSCLAVAGGSAAARKRISRAAAARTGWRLATAEELANENAPCEARGAPGVISDSWRKEWEPPNLMAIVTDDRAGRRSGRRTSQDPAPTFCLDSANEEAAVAELAAAMFAITAPAELRSDLRLAAG